MTKTRNKQRQRGFLPMDTNLFDRCFISVVVLVAVHLLWMRFLEAHVTLWAATAISIALGALIVSKG
jgi:predicted small integral membrane protein